MSNLRKCLICVNADLLYIIQKIQYGLLKKRMSTPLVTIIVPCYNVEKYVRQCVESVLAQTVTNVQIILVDDRSTDGTADVLREYEKKDSRVLGIYHSLNLGLSGGRNSGIENAKAPLLMFVDGDDYLPLDATEKLLRINEKSPADFIAANSTRCSDDGRPLGSSFTNHGLAYFNLENGIAPLGRQLPHFYNCWAKLYRTELILKYGIRSHLLLRHAQDVLFSTTYLCKACKSAVIDYDESVYFYRQSPTSIVHSIALDKRLNCLSILIEELDKLAEETSQPRWIVSQKCAEYLWAIRKFSANNEERRERVKALLSTELFREHINPLVSQYGKFKHRFLLRALVAGHVNFIRWW